MFLKKIKGAALLIMLLLAWANADALHIKGGWIYYTYLGQSTNGNYQYKVTLKVYR